MTKDEILAKITEIGTTEDAAQRRMLLTEITDEVTSVYDTNETLTAANTKFEADNKKLQEYNMQLFLKVGGQTKKEPESNTGSETKDLKYEDLFDEKGDLK